ncbi:MAG: helix-turn-helix transcriptional regulator [Clostridia bacterium]|nr:helix-turn-helix transcriptional regulator [Clostridia bacterium]
MDQVKIGKFIAELRKNNNLTQMQLAEKLNITDRAISKWENGKALPDTAIMLELCKIFNITVNDLLHGEVIDMDNYKEQSEQLLTELVKQKEESDKNLLSLEILIGVLSMVILLGFTFVAAFVEMQDWLRIVLIVFGFVMCFIGLFFAIKIEQTAGYYECQKCKHRYVPDYKSVLFAMHVNRTRYMRCPKCNQKYWQKKVISKN